MMTTEILFREEFYQQLFDTMEMNNGWFSTLTIVLDVTDR